MKRPLQLPLAIALVLGGTNVFALGLGPVHVKSKLNQPLDAEIPIVQGSQGEAEGLLVNLATAEDFDRVGLNRSRLNVPLEFAVVKGADGQLVIKVTSKEIVRDSYLDFLLEANWPKGRLLREYTVLLDPPLTAPARSTASAPAATPRATTRPLRETRTEKTTVAAAPAPRPERHHAAVPAPAAAPAHKAAAGEYGPVEAGETLSGIAREARPDEGVNLNQMMLALYKSNPDAFYKNNINALKRGAILRVPSADEIKAVGSAREAAAQVHAQIEDWRGGRATPTLVAETAPKAAAAPPPAVSKTPAPKPAAGTAPVAATAKSGGERLELVPPKAGRGSVAMADQPGSGAANAAAATELKSELARTKEALTTREQETGELKSRVKELEDLKNKNDRLLGLKDSEIAELQQKLRQMQEQAGKPAAAKPGAGSAAAVVTAPAATPAAAGASKPATSAATANKPGTESKIDKQDIWGDTGTAATAASPGTAGTSASATPPPASSASAPITATSTPPASATPATTPPSGASSSTNAATPAATPGANAGGATVTPLPPTPTTTPTPAATKPAAKPMAPSTAAKAPANPAHAEPWYDAGWVKPTALAAGIVLLLLGLLGLRKRKPAGTTRGSLAEAFGDSPMAPAGGSLMSVEAEADKLREQLQDDPGNVGLHLELLGLYYAERDVPNFEREAEAMHEHVTDPHQPEWLEAQAMGQELAPHNPLFAGGAHYDDGDAAIASAHADTLERPTAHEHEYEEFADFSAEPGAATAAHEDFGFDIPPAQHTHAFAEPGMPAPPPVAPTGLEDSFDFDHLPPLEPGRPGGIEAAPAVPAARADEDFYAGEDAIGTKLDLARAYLDMGDPEGARSMLEEVVAEGSDVQKAEARRLIADIR